MTTNDLLIKLSTAVFWRQVISPLIASICKNGSVFLALAFVFGASAKADIWGCVGADNVAHFSAFQLDDRYKLFFLGSPNFDTEKVRNTELQTDVQRSLRSTAFSETINVSAPWTLPNTATASTLKTQTFFDISPDYKAVKYLLREASVVNGIDYELLQALIATESGFNAYAVSPKGAIGLMQLIPPTAERYGVKGDKDSPIGKKLTDPRTNIFAGTRHLKNLISLFPGRLELAVAAYNAGEGAVQRAGNQIPNFPETKNYVKTVMQLYADLKPSNLTAVKLAPEREQLEMMAGSFSSVRTVGRGNMISSITTPAATGSGTK